MRIVLLAHNLLGGGAHVVGINFIAALKKVAPEHTFFIIIPHGIGFEELSLPRRADTYVYRGGRSLFMRWRFDTLILPKIIKKFDPDVILGLGNLGSTSSSCKQAFLFHYPRTIYSYRHYGRENLRNLIRDWLLKKRIQRCLKYTQLVFCQTPVARKRFNSFLNYPIDQIKIMPNAVSEFSKIDKEQADIPEVLRDSKYYNLFFLTKYYPHKNLEILIDLFKKHREKMHGIRCIVTLSPEQHQNAAKFLDNIHKYNLSEYIVNVGPLQQDELAGYYYNCDGLLFPTLLESFSGTYLEAMHFGLPILTSDIDFAHYICDDAALYFDPWDTRDIIKKIFLLKDTPDIGVELLEKGKKRMSGFFKNWDIVVSDVIKELEKL